MRHNFKPGCPVTTVTDCVNVYSTTVLFEKRCACQRQKLFNTGIVTAQNLLRILFLLSKIVMAVKIV